MLRCEAARRRAKLPGRTGRGPRDRDPRSWWSSSPDRSSKLPRRSTDVRAKSESHKLKVLTDCSSAVPEFARSDGENMFRTGEPYVRVSGMLPNCLSRQSPQQSAHPEPPKFPKERVVRSESVWAFGNDSAANDGDFAVQSSRQFVYSRVEQTYPRAVSTERSA